MYKCKCTFIDGFIHADVVAQLSFPKLHFSFFFNFPETHLLTEPVYVMIDVKLVSYMVNTYTIFFQARRK